MIIFDLDGTLWDTTDTTLEAANNVAKRHNEIKGFTKETIINGMGLSNIENAHNYMPYLEEEKALIYLDEIIKENISIIAKKGARLYEGELETIKSLSKKYKLGIVTNSNNEYAELFLKTSKLEKYFSDYIGAASCNITKSAAIKEMCKNNNEPNSFYIGDIKKDKIATEEAGITFIHAKYGFEPNLESQLYIQDIRELIDLIEKQKKDV